MRRFAWGAALCYMLASAGGGSALAQFSGLVRARITRPVSEDKISTLRGNVHPLARAEFDHGAAPPDLPLDRMLLVLTRSTQQEAALQSLLASQQNPSSPLYHRWLTAQEFGRQFGAADQDVQVVTAWLEAHGFRIERVANGRNLIEFSGTASEVEGAFHTQIHKYVINGKAHWANATNPQIPTALTGVVAGVASLYNFRKKPQIIRSAGSFESAPQFTGSNGSHALAPADYATIYDINPVYNAGITGTGAVIAVVARSDINLQDITSFRSTFNLSANPPQVILNGPDPGDLGGDEEAEAVLDTSWSGAVAPGSTVKLVVSKSTNVTDGVDLSEAYIIDNNLGDVMTESFGSCEASYTAAEAAAVSSLAAQAAAQGITYTVASGDSGAEGCDDPNTAPATGPLSVNVLASTPYTIAVGGTQFNENGNNAAYWQSSNGLYGESAISYIPEDVWNESCGAGSCSAGNSPGLWAGGGGVSTLFTKPVWQAGVPGIPGDGMRDVPDVSLSAAGHDAYLLCLDGSCTPNSTGRISFQGYSGTSAATPSFAGIMALIIQYTGARQGQANYILYPMAARSYATCSPSVSNCIFHDVTVGNNAVPGQYGYGTAAAKYQAGPGYDLATGLGSVDVTNLILSWSTGNGTPHPQLSVSAVDFGSGYIGLPVTKTVTLSNTGTASLPVLEVAVSLTSGASSTSGAAAGSFSETNTCGRSVAPQARCQIFVVFTPAAPGSQSGSLIVNTTGVQTLPLTGDGLSASTLVSNSSGISFGNQTLLTISAPQQVVIANPTGSPINIAAIGFTSGTDSFNEANNCPGVLQIAQNCVFNITFVPKLLGTHSFTIGAAPGAPVISGTGTGIADTPFAIVNLLSGKALDVTGASISDGTTIQQFTLNGNAQQWWWLLDFGDGTLALENLLSGKALDVTNASPNNGALIQQWTFDNTWQQHWRLSPSSDLTYSIVSDLDGKALDVTNASLADGAHIQQWSPNGSEQQQWQLVPMVAYNIVNALTRKAIDVTNASQNNGALIQQWQPNGAEQQMWRLIPIGGNVYKILNALSGKSLDVTNASDQNGAVIQQWDYSGSLQQLWSIELTLDGDYEIRNVLSGKVLDVTNASDLDGALLQQWDADGFEQQHWQLIRAD